MCNRELDQWSVYPTQDADDDRLGFAHALVEQERTEGGHDGESREQSAGERIRVGLRHWAEYVALDPAQREQRNEADDDDRGGKKDRPVDLGRCTKDRCEFSPQAERGRASAPLRGAPSARCRKMFSTIMTLASTMRPKSIAPTDSRLADSPRMTRMPIAKKRAKGMVDDTMMALRKSPRKIH